MNLLELSNTLTITEREINGIPLIKSKIESKLNALKARTNVSENEIDFSTIKVPRSASGYTEANLTLFRIYKEGKIVIVKQKEELKISWIVKLDTLYTLALSIAFVLSIFSSFVIELVFSMIIGIAVFLATVFIGVLFILSAMNELVLSSVFKK